MKFTVPMEAHIASRPRVTNGRAYTEKGYAKWRKAFAVWFNEWINDHKELIEEMALLRNTQIPFRNRKSGRISDQFAGYYVRMEFVLKRPKNSNRTFPVSVTGGDLDNYLKAMIDGIFESEACRTYGIDDRYIQSLVGIKRYQREGESPHVDVEIKQI